MHIRDQRSSLFGFILNLQFGAYVILCGLVISTIYIIKASKKEINNFIGKYEFDESKMENNNVISTQHKSFSKVFCTQCGTELQKGNKFCTNCGAKI
jgi:hypothetical protein